MSDVYPLSSGQSGPYGEAVLTGVSCVVKVVGVAGLVAADIAQPEIAPALTSTVVSLITGAMVDCSLTVAFAAGMGTGTFKDPSAMASFSAAASSADLFSNSGLLSTAGETFNSDTLKDLSAAAKAIEASYSLSTATTPLEQLDSVVQDAQAANAVTERVDAGKKQEAEKFDKELRDAHDKAQPDSTPMQPPTESPTGLDAQMRYVA